MRHVVFYLDFGCRYTIPRIVKNLPHLYIKNHKFCFRQFRSKSNYNKSYILLWKDRDSGKMKYVLLENYNLENSTS